MNKEISDDDFWDTLEDAEESTNSKADNAPWSLEERLGQFSLDESKALDMLKKLEARKKKMTSQAIAANRKARNHRLFKLGEIVEKVLGRDITNDDISKFEIFLTEERCAKRLSRVMNNDYDADWFFLKIIFCYLEENLTWL